MDYWNINRALSYQRQFNWIVGAKGVGKTFGTKKKALEEHVKKGGEFLYIRRFKAEAKERGKIFNAFIKENTFPNLELKANDLNTYSANGEVCGHFKVLSTATVDKGVAEYPNVTWIIFDEFMLDTGRGYHKYIPNEVQVFLELIDTVIRSRENIKIFCLGNGISTVTPYFLYFGLEMPKAGGIWTNKHHLVENVTRDSLGKQKPLTKFQQAIAGTEYGDYSLNNVMLRENDNFISRKPNAKNEFNIIYSGITLGIWKGKDGLYYVSEDFDKSNHYVYAFDINEHTVNSVLLKTAGQRGQFKNFIDYFNFGYVRFENQMCKNLMYKIILGAKGF